MENSFSLLSLFSGRDLMTLSVSLILLAASVMSWAVIIEKIRLWQFQKHHPVSVKSSDNLDTVVDKLIRPFDKNLWFLSMVSYVAPFVGLFGTVWGVMDSFGQHRRYCAWVGCGIGDNCFGVDCGCACGNRI